MAANKTLTRSLPLVGLFNGLSACANFATVLFHFSGVSRIVQFLPSIYAPGGTGQFQPLRRYWLGRAMGKAKGG